MKKPLFIGTATWLMAATILINSTPLFAGRKTEDSSQEKSTPEKSIIIDDSDKEGEDSPIRKKDDSTDRKRDSTEDSPKIPSSHKAISTDVSPVRKSPYAEKLGELSLTDDSDDDFSSEEKGGGLKRLKSLSLTDDFEDDSSDENKKKKEFSSFKWEDLKEIGWEDLKQIKNNKTTLYPRRKISEPEQNVNFESSYQKKPEGSQWSCASIYNQTCSLGRQFLRSNVITGSEAGGRFDSNVENLICETNLFNEWHFLAGPKVKNIFEGGETKYSLYNPCDTIFVKINAQQEKVVLVGSSYDITHTNSKSLDTINQGKHIFQVLERLTASMPWVKKILLPLTIIIVENGTFKIYHQVLMEMNTGEKPSIVIWDSLSELSTKDIKPVIEQVIGEIKLAQIEITSRTEDEFEILESKNIISKHLNLHTAPMTYQQLNFQLPGTGNCTRFALFFALLRSEGEDLEKYTVDTANRFCTFVKNLDPM